MERIVDFFKNPSEYEGKTITISGWIRNNRSQAQFGFIDLNDGTSFKTVQVV